MTAFWIALVSAALSAVVSAVISLGVSAMNRTSDANREWETRRFQAYFDTYAQLRTMALDVSNLTFGMAHPYRAHVDVESLKVKVEASEREFHQAAARLSLFRGDLEKMLDCLDHTFREMQDFARKQDEVPESTSGQGSILDSDDWMSLRTKWEGQLEPFVDIAREELAPRVEGRFARRASGHGTRL